MNISREEASAALDSIHDANRKVAERRNYADAAPFLILWGVVWVLCNGITDLAPRWSGRSWLTGIVLGAIVTVYLIVTMAMRERRVSVNRAANKEMGQRFALLGIATWSYFISMFLVLGPMPDRRMGAFISLFWTITYMAAGAWVGMRLFIIGLVATAAIVLGYLFVEQHFSLWMAVFGGGALIAGGLWLRRL
jgi:hypothetical protein